MAWQISFVLMQNKLVFSVTVRMIFGEDINGSFFLAMVNEPLSGEEVSLI